MPNDMRTSLSRTLPLWMCLSCAVALSATGAGFKSLSGHVPAITKNLAPIGAVPSTNELRLAIGVPLRDTEGLKRFLADIYSPASPNYRHYLRPQEFAARFSATEADYAAVKEFARSNGFEVTAEFSNRLVLDVRAKPKDVERAFHLHLNRFRHPSEGREFFAPDQEPTIDAALAVTDVQGLDNASRAHSHSHSRPINFGAASPKVGSAPASGGYMGDDFRNAYAREVTLTGAGQVVGLLQGDGFSTYDIEQYAQLAGGARTNIVISTVLVDGATGNIMTDGEGEVALDIEMVMSMAPGVSQIILYEGNPNYWIPNDVLIAMAANPTVKNLSSSWGWAGGLSATTDFIFGLMAAQGQTFFNASGDGDAFTDGVFSANGVENPGLKNAPSSSPFITQVGGTTLTMTNINGSQTYISEKAWNWGYDPNKQKSTGSSGGISSIYTIPEWQAGISMVTNQGSTAFRNTPDVAMTADQVFVIHGSNRTWDTLGGTSCAAPLWAGFAALANQQAASNGQPSIGFLNPTIYQIANSLLYTSCFRDITNGDNTRKFSPSKYSAVPGYDLCTGLGTPNGMGLLNALGGTWVDFNYAGDVQNGTYVAPYKSFAQAATAVASGGVILFKTSGSKVEPVHVNKAMSVHAPVGPATVYGH